MSESPKKPEDISSILEEADEALKAVKDEEERREAAAKAEKPEAKKKFSPELFIEDRDNRGVFEKLSDKTKEFAAGLFERAKMNIVDRAKVMFNDNLFERHHEKATLLKFKLEDKEKGIQRSEELKSGHSERLSSIQKELGPISPKLLAKADLEKEEIQKNIDKEKEIMDRLERKLNYRNEKKSAYEIKRNRICENVIERVNERLGPYENKIERLRGQKDQLGSEIEAFCDKNKEFSAKIGDLEKKMKATPLKVERKIYRSYIKEFKKNIKENGKFINKTINEEAKIGHQVAKFEKKAGPWWDKRSEFESIAKRKAAETGVPSRKKEAAGWEEKKAKGTEKIGEKKEQSRDWKNISEEEKNFWTERTGDEETAQNYFKNYKGDFTRFAIEQMKQNQVRDAAEWLAIRAKKKGKETGEKKEAEKEPELTPRELIEKWNEHFGSKLPLSQRYFSELFFAKEDDLDEETDFDNFSKKLRGYFDFTRKEKLVGKKTRQKDFNKYVEMFLYFIKGKKK